MGVFKSILTTIAAILIQMCGMAQMTNGVPDILPKSPEAFAITKYGDLPVGLFTGTAQFNLPIYTIKSGKITHEVSLNYATNGVKVDEIASRIGMNWKLEGCGVIARTVRGLPDEMPGVQFIRPQNHSNTDDRQFFDFLLNYQALFPSAEYPTSDPQPDVFSYSFQNYSGTFIILNGEIKEAKKSGIKIIKGNLLQTFTLITPDGYSYFFGNNSAQENTRIYSYFDGAHPTAYQNPITAWYLTKIKNPFNDSVTFNYTTLGSFSTPIDYFSGVIQTTDVSLPSSGLIYKMPNGKAEIRDFTSVDYLTTSVDRYQNYIEIEPLRTVVQKVKLQSVILDNIVFKNGKIQFYYSNRSDVANEKKYDSICILNSENQLIKSFALAHSYSVASNINYYTNDLPGQGKLQSNNPELKQRLFLAAVKEYNITASNSLEHRFEYDNINDLPPRLSFSQDLFGFFNGKVNQYFFPNNTYVEQFTGLTQFGGDRSFDFNFARKGVLTKITYPTGGSTTIEYEPHYIYGFPIQTISNNSINASLINVGNVRDTIASDIWLNELSNNNTVIQIEAVWHNGPPPPMEIRGDEEIRYWLIDADTKQCLICANGIPVSNIESIDVSSLLQANHRYYLKLQSNRVGLSGYGEIKRKISTTTTAHSTPVGGIRLKSLINTDSVTSIISIKKFRYADWNDITNKSTGILMTGTDVANNYVTLRRYRGTAGTSPVIELPNINWQLTSNSVLDLYMNDYNNIVYSKVIETYGNNAENGGVEHHYRTYSKQPAVVLNDHVYLAGNWGVYAWDRHTGVYLPNAPGSNTDYLNGMESFTGKFSVENNTRKFIEKKYDYHSADPRVFSIDTFYVINKPLPVFGVHGPNDTPFWFYDVNRYKYYQVWTHLDSTRTVYFSNNDSMVTVTKFDYDNLVSLEPTAIIQEDSRKQILRKEFRYPNEFNADPFTSMVEANRIKEVISSTEYKNGVLQKTERTNYNFFNTDLILPSSYITQLKGSNEETRVDIHKYDINANILEWNKFNDVKKSYIWDHNSAYPIAEVTGGAVAQIAYTSFETNDLGGWALNSGSVINTTAPVTGSKSNQGGVNKSVPLGNYIVGVWSSANTRINGQLLTQLPIKIIGSMKYFEVKLNNITSINVSGDNIDEVKLIPEGAQIVTMTYKPLIGITSQCDVRNNIKYFEYDEFNRLLRVRDSEKHILKQYDYKYKSTVNITP